MHHDQQHYWNVLDFRGSGADIFRLFKDESNAFFLDSSLCQGPTSRYSFIGFDPFDIFHSSNSQALMHLREKFRRYAGSSRLDFSPFPSGIVGFLNYDLGLKLENIKVQSKEDLSIPDCYFGFYDILVSETFKFWWHFSFNEISV